jgi:hypothetical protein
MDGLDTAITAMRHWTSGAATGEWSSLIGMLDPELTFQVPVDGFLGRRHGVAEASRFFDHLAAVLRAELTVTSTLISADRAGDRVAFEVSVRGEWLERSFVQALCLVFVVGGDRVRAFFEYLAWPGGLDPSEPPRS